MSARKPSLLPPEPPPVVAEALRGRLTAPEEQVLSAVFAVRMTAQQMDNTISGWMVASVGSPARFLILMRLWAASGGGVPHKEIVASLGVTRATVSGLMAGLERDGLVTSAVARDDRRNLLASLTPKGEAIVEKTFEANKARLRAAFAGLSSDELTTLTTLLQRFRQGITAISGDPEKKSDRADQTKATPGKVRKNARKITPPDPGAYQAKGGQRA
jgi:DNA-binding MarR family transcriptional regulator